MRKRRNQRKFRSQENENFSPPRDRWRIEIDASQDGPTKVLVRWRFARFSDGKFRAYFDDPSTVQLAVRALQRCGWHGRAVRMRPLAPPPEAPPRPQIEAPSGFEVTLPRPANELLKPYRPGKNADRYYGQ